MEVAANTNERILIQPRGALFGFDTATEQLVLTSENAHEFVGASAAEDLIGLTVRDCLGSTTAHAMRNAESQSMLDTRRMFLGGFDLVGGSYDLTIFSSHGRAIIEAVPSGADKDPTAYEVLKDAQVLSDSLVQEAGQGSGAERLVALLRTISGYHCVVLGRDRDQATETVALAGRSDIASSIRSSARQLHVFADHSQRGIGLHVPDGEPRPNMELAALGFPPSRALSVLTGGKAAASASLGIWRGSQHWGSLWFFHDAPRVPNKRTQLAIAHLIPLMSEVLFLNY